MNDFPPKQLPLLDIGLGRFVRYDELKPLGIPYSRQHLAKLEADGQFPARVKLSARVIAWRLGDIRDWMLSRGQA
jgi:prophage regulatory protein